jgi:hypothetical protein
MVPDELRKKSEFAFIRRRGRYLHLSFVVVALFICHCGGGDGGGGSNNSPPPAQTRSFYLGFTPFPPDLSPASLDYVYDRLRQDADIVAHHFDNGIPWNEALSDIYPYHSHIMSDWNTRKTKTPAGHKVYVAVTPINSDRTGMALYRSSSDDQPLRPPFDAYAASSAFNHPDVKTAYLNCCKRVIDFFRPDYFAFGIEVNLLRKVGAAPWNNYLELHRYIYTQLKLLYPNLPIFASVAGVPLLYGYESPPAEFTSFPDPAQAYLDSQRTALSEVLGHSDYYALAFYPHISAYYGGNLPVSTLDNLFALSTKPTAIAETGYPAQNTEAFGIPFAGSESLQNRYMDDLLKQADFRKFKFVINFILKDYDQLCTEMGGCSDVARLWRDTGFYSETGSSRLALQTWKAFLSRPYKSVP